MKTFLGNHRIREKLIRDAKAKSFPHAILLSGPKGTGKFQFLELLAEILLEKKSQKFFPPEVMKVDTLYQEGVFSDMEKLSKLSFFDQSHRKKLRKKSNTIGVDDLEKFTKHLFETTSSEYKIVLIKEVERMTRETANKFLKTLEEPPQKTLFLMTCSSEKKLLTTFLSRVRKEKFSLASEELIQNFLKYEDLASGLTEQEKQEISDISAGRGEVLIRLIKDEKYRKEEKEKKEFFQTIFTMTSLEKMKCAEDFAKKNISEISDIFFFLENFLRKKLRQSVESEDTMKSKFYKKSLQVLHSTQSGINQNGNKRMLLEQLFLNI